MDYGVRERRRARGRDEGLLGSETEAEKGLKSVLQLSGLGCWLRPFASVNKCFSEMRTIV